MKLILITILALNLAANEYICKSTTETYSNNTQKFMMVSSRGDAYQTKHYLRKMVDNLEDMIIYCDTKDKNNTQEIYDKTLKIYEEYFGVK